MRLDVYYRLCREVDILLRSTCQGSVLLCLQGGFLMSPFDGMASRFKFSQLVTQCNTLREINVMIWTDFCKKLLLNRNKGTKTVKGSLI